MNFIGQKAEILCELLQHHECTEFKTLKRETELSDLELWAAIGWLTYQGRLTCLSKLCDGKEVILFSLVE